MKITSIKRNLSPHPAFKIGYLYENIPFGVLVLCTGINTNCFKGVILQDNTNPGLIGLFQDDWDYSDFVEFSGEIIIQQ